MKEKQEDKSKALRDEGMSSPSDVRNRSTPRKAKDMPEDEAHRNRNPSKDYGGRAKKDHRAFISVKRACEADYGV